MSNVLLPSLDLMQDFAGFVAVWVAWGIGFSIVCWTLGYLVWFVIQFFR